MQEKSLAGITLLSRFADDERKRLEGQCRWRRFRRGEAIVDYGHLGRDVFFIVEGAVSVVNFASSGREISFATIEAGDFFGEIAAIDGKPRSASVVALQDTLVAMLAPEAFQEHVIGNPHALEQLLKRLTSMVRAGDQRIMELSTLAATQRVYSELLRMSKPDAAVPDLWVIRSLPPLRDIASRVSTTRETTARAVSYLYKSGLVRRKGRNLYLMDRPKLEDIVKQLSYHAGAAAS